MYLGRALFEEGNAAEGLAMMRESVGDGIKIHSYTFWPAHAAMLADGLARTDETDEALRYLEKALEVTNETKDRWSEPEIHRIRGEVLRRGDSDDQSEAEASYRCAIEAARHSFGQLGDSTARRRRARC